MRGRDVEADSNDILQRTRMGLVGEVQSATCRQRSYFKRRRCCSSCEESVIDLFMRVFMSGNRVTRATVDVNEFMILSLSDSRLYLPVSIAPYDCRPC